MSGVVVGYVNVRNFLEDLFFFGYKQGQGYGGESGWMEAVLRTYYFFLLWLKI